eukprot:gene26165-34219_t
MGLSEVDSKTIERVNDSLNKLESSTRLLAMTYRITVNGILDFANQLNNSTVIDNKEAAYSIQLATIILNDITTKGKEAAKTKSKYELSNSRSIVYNSYSDDILNDLQKRVSLGENADLGQSNLASIGEKVVAGNEAILSIDSNTGRVILDIGSAFKDKDAYLASNVTAVPLSADDLLHEAFIEQHHIEKHLEISSCDEYDDFNPRFPNPKDKSHRRGDSYFNSDVESHASEALGGFDLSSIANMALALESKFKGF